MAYNTVQELFTAICDVIRNKKGTSAPINHQDIPQEIESISGGGGGGGKEYTVKYAYGGDKSDLAENLDKYIINASYMFVGATDDDVAVINGKSAEIVNLSYMFNGAQITGMDCSKWDVSKALKLDRMFYNCSQLETIDVSTWDTSNVRDCSYMFCGCTGITEMDLSMWDLGKCENVTSMFSSSNKISKLRLPSLSGVRSTSYAVTSTYTTRSNCTDFQILGLIGDPTYESNITYDAAGLWRSVTEAEYKLYEAFANALEENTSGYTRTIKLYSSFYNNMTDARKALLTDKGYTIST